MTAWIARKPSLTYPVKYLGRPTSSCHPQTQLHELPANNLAFSSSGKKSTLPIAAISYSQVKSGAYRKSYHAYQQTKPSPWP
jgi:hypothetical protein